MHRAGRCVDRPAATFLHTCRKLVLVRGRLAIAFAAVAAVDVPTKALLVMCFGALRAIYIYVVTDSRTGTTSQISRGTQR